MKWFRKVSADPNDLGPVVEMLEFFEGQYQDALKDLDVDNKLIWEMAVKLPGLMSFRYEQWREIFRTHEWLSLHEHKLVKEHTRRYMENYNRTLSERTAEQYALGDDEVITFKTVVIEVKLLMDKFEGITKGLEAMRWQIGNLVKLRDAGIEDALF